MLLNGHTGADAAGRVIEAFGEFVIGGNYAVGIVVFVILVVINFIVVTKGAGRVSEVTARFTLDAMPGKQMAIDADLNAGPDHAGASRRTRATRSTQEADFYGAMDGASKFVRGDAIAGILIVVINIIGGLVIGTLDHGLAIAEAGRIYTLLTIGDGLVAQIPALLSSTAVAIIVTRMSRASALGEQVVKQLVAASARADDRGRACSAIIGLAARHAERHFPDARGGHDRSRAIGSRNAPRAAAAPPRRRSREPKRLPRSASWIGRT